MDNKNLSPVNEQEREEYVQNMKAWADAMNMSEDEMEKPFTMDLDYAKSQAEKQSKPVRKPMVKPFRMDPAANKEKLYLILLYIYDSNSDTEYAQEFQFIKGRQQTYDTLKTYLEMEDLEVDAMKSRVLVDSPKVSISHKYSVFAFMRDMKERLAVEDNTSFDINDYYYEEDEENENGKE